MDISTGLVLVAAVGTVVPLTTACFTFLQNRAIARAASVAAEKSDALAHAAAMRVETVRSDLQVQSATVAQKLDTIHTLVNSQLTDAVERFKQALDINLELLAIFAQLAPNDPRIRALMERMPPDAVKSMKERQAAANR